jgi:hypothetical protein
MSVSSGVLGICDLVRQGVQLTYSLAVLDHRRNVGKVLEVPCVHRPKLNDFITNSDAL